MTYSHEVEQMCPITKGPHHGPAPIPEEGAWVKAYLSYDEGRTWAYAGGLEGGTRQLRAGLLAVRPVRCPHLRLRLEGGGGCRLYSLSAVYGEGSDLP